MVQLRQRGEMSSGSYWKLDGKGGTVSRILDRTEELGYRCKQGRATSKNRALHLRSRAERGLLSYETLPKDELKLFCVQRNLQSPRKLTLSALRDVLEKADEDATFDDFLRLPPELRLIILKQHVSWVRGPHSRSISLSQPPISRICRLTRKESLPIFNATCPVRFTIPFENPPTWRAMKDHTERFARISAAQDLSNVDKLSIYFVLPSAAWHGADFNLAVNLTSGSCKVYVAGGWMGFLTPQDSRCGALIEEQCGEIIKGIAAREGPHKLRSEDLVVLSQAVAHGAYNHVTKTMSAVEKLGTSRNHMLTAGLSRIEKFCEQTRQLPTDISKKATQ